MAADYDRFHIITGGPGSGKTTLIETLGRRGFARSVEAGRSILMDQMAIGGNAVHWGDQRTFAELMLQHEMRSYHIAEEEEGPVLFDRHPGARVLLHALRARRGACALPSRRRGLPVQSHGVHRSALARDLCQRQGAQAGFRRGDPQLRALRRGLRALRLRPRRAAQGQRRRARGVRARAGLTAYRWTSVQPKPVHTA